MNEILKVALEHTVEIVFTLLGMLITMYVVPWLKNKNMYDTVKIIVQAAEKVAQNNNIDKHKWVEENLKKAGIPINESVSVMIESAVQEIDAAFGVKKPKKQ